MILRSNEMRSLISVWLISMSLVGCVTGYQHVPAPVEDRMAGATLQPATGTNSNQHDVQPGFYAVRPGDTLIRIGLEQGQNWRDIAKWNSIDNPDRIEVGQVLRIQPPVANENVSSESTGVVVTPVTRTQIIEPVVNSPPSRESSVASIPPKLEPPSASDKSTLANKDIPVRQSAPNVTSPIEISFLMPSKGKITGTFDGAKNKGIDISGKLGDPIISAADGRVVYAGSGLRGYGNLIIIKHNNTYLTAYAHNDKILVKEDQFIKQGQKIAEMGNSEADQVKLHFEIRKMGKPVDPVPYLNTP